MGMADIDRHSGMEKLRDMPQGSPEDVKMLGLFMDVGAMMTVIPRISTPTLTPQEMAELDPADLTSLSVEVVTFLLKKSVLAGLPTV